MPRKAYRKPEWQLSIARERIGILFGLAEKEFKRHPERSRRYIELARKIGMRYNVKIPVEFKRSFCKKCNAFSVPGVNSRTRANPTQRAVVRECLECGHIERYPYRREKLIRKKPK